MSFVFSELVWANTSLEEQSHSISLEYEGEKILLYLPKEMRDAVGYSIKTDIDPKEINEEKKKKEEEDQNKKNRDRKEKAERFSYLLTLAYQQFHKNELADALSSLREAEGINKKSARVYTMIGSVFFKLGWFEKARQNWTKSLRINPSQNQLIQALRKLP